MSADALDDNFHYEDIPDEMEADLVDSEGVVNELLVLAETPSTQKRKLKNVEEGSKKGKKKHRKSFSSSDTSLLDLTDASDVSNFLWDQFMAEKKTLTELEKGDLKQFRVAGIFVSIEVIVKESRCVGGTRDHDASRLGDFLTTGLHLCFFADCSRTHTCS